jgi:hypothetical protein
MSETFRSNSEKVLTREQKIMSLAVELYYVSREIFPFSGVDPESYVKMKASDEEYPGFTTPTDEIIERLKNEGMKVVLGKNPESGNVYILPAGSDDIEMDSISPKQLQISDGMNEKLAQLIELMRG